MEKPLHTEGNNQQNEKVTQEWKKIFANHTSDKRLISEIQNEHLQLSGQNKKQTTQSKMGKGPEQTFFQSRHTHG